MVKKTIALLASILVLFSLSGCGAKNTVCLNDYTTIVASGSNGNGIVTAEIDYEKILEDYKDYIKEDGVKNLPSWVSYAADDDSARSAINILFYGVPAGKGTYSNTFGVHFSQETQLKNGDVIEVKFTDSPEKLDALRDVFDVEFKYTHFDYTVEGLK